MDYTPVKYVKKPAGARPGMVVYTTYETAWVSPDGELAKRLRVKLTEKAQNPFRFPEGILLVKRKKRMPNFKKRRYSFMIQTKLTRLLL